MTAPPSAPRLWWRQPGPLLALVLHGVVFLGLFQLRFPEGEWARMERQLPAAASTSQWFRMIVETHGYGGLVTYFFDTHDEIRLYHRYAQVALRGIDPRRPAAAPEQGSLRPYRDIPIEYQPGALLVLVPPAIFARELRDYQTWFTAWCGVLYLGALLLGLDLIAGGGPLRAASANRALWWSLAFLLCFGGVAAARFDHAVPVACLVACWALRRADRTGSTAWFAVAGAVIALGVFVKIVPGLVLGAGLLGLWATRAPAAGRRALAVGAGTALTLLVLHGAFYFWWGDGYLRSYAYHVDRGVQLESTYAGVIAAAGGSGAPLAVIEAAGAYDLRTPLTGAVKALAPVLFLALVGLVAARVAVRRRGAAPVPRDLALVLLTTVLLLAFILTNKVFSPQYLLWLGPLIAAGYGGVPALRPVAIALLLAAALSQVIFPHLYDRLTGLEALAVALLNLRNALLAAMLGWLLWRLPALLTREADPEH
ncbi:MAG: hypothetical protein RLZZ15_976 [Verrucomicrobiota bacterium]|jgi:hypothetical protein